MFEEPMDDPTADCGISWPINYDAETLCRDSAMCEDMLRGTGTEVFKCGSLEEYGLPLEIDKVGEQELISYNLVGFEHFGKAMTTLF
jgi:hypothetical protein